MIGLFLPLLLAGPPSAEPPASEPVLIFEFPDGTRGGRGKIDGHGPRPSARFSENVAEEYVIQLVRRCGVADAVARRSSHSIQVSGRRSEKDLIAAGCVRVGVGYDFNVGYGHREVGGYATMNDESVFRPLWDRQPRIRSRPQ